RSRDDVRDVAAGAALMWTATRELSVFAPIADRPTLETRLAAIDAALDKEVQPTEPFSPAAMPDTHFMRFVIIPDAELGDLLAWEVNYDGELEPWLELVAEVAGIDRIFECCVAYPGTRRRDDWVAWMLEHRICAAAFYCAYPGVPRSEIVNDLAVRQKLRELADAHRSGLESLPPHEIQRRLYDGVAADAKLKSSVILDEDVRWFLSRVLALIAAVIVFPFLLAIVLVWWLWALLAAERKDEVAPEPQHAVHTAAELAALEDKIRQNQLTHVVDIKPGVFRAFTLWTVLHVIGVLAGVFYVDGHLGGITSIHFARWVIVRDRRDVPRAQRRDRLVFFSNYDGSWESYLGEFIDRAAMGLTAIWSSTEGFPKTKLLMFQGATDEERFKQWTRDHQLVTQMWWSGVRESTVQNVRDDIWLRRRLAAALDDDERALWLRKL
ncbi:MAG TPA: hypothetical protein VFQ65_29860, partial [Kofleriaceae bacterium]|nr:hypothetical protein [Kofleriaceae bacterium]